MPADEKTGIVNEDTVRVTITTLTSEREFGLARDYYEVLGVRRNASTREIKKAFHHLARQYHPDITGNDPRSTERFKEISEAYEVLSDSQKRRRYDLFGHPNQPKPGATPSFDPFEALQTIVSQVGDLLKPQASDPSPGIDVELKQAITFQEAYTGTQKEIKMTLPRPCKACDGQGHRVRSKPHPCPDCHGSGRASPFDFLPMGLRCQTCDGTGNVSSGPCRGCHSQGHRIESENLKVHIPAGITNGARIRLEGRGQAGKRGGPPGDLYVVIQLEPDNRFFRRGNSLFTRVRISALDAKIGGEVFVPVPDGRLRLQLPAGTQGGQTFRIAQRGFPTTSQAERHDLFVKIQIDKEFDPHPP